MILSFIAVIMQEIISPYYIQTSHNRQVADVLGDMTALAAILQDIGPQSDCVGCVILSLVLPRKCV